MVTQTRTFETTFKELINDLKNRELIRTDLKATSIKNSMKGGKFLEIVQQQEAVRFSIQN